MQLRIRRRDLDVAPGTHRSLETRIRLAVGRHAADIATALLTIAPRPSSEGAALVSCRLRLRLRLGVGLEIEESAPDLEGAVSLLTWRLVHLLNRPRFGASGARRRAPGLPPGAAWR